jgi:hypothetical protein
MSTGEDAVREIAKAVGGTINEIGRLPDGSGFATMSIPLSKDHWIYSGSGRDDSPAPFRLGAKDKIRVIIGDHFDVCFSKSVMQEYLRDAFKYAIRSSTGHGEDMDFDPNAMLQNLMTGLFGYNTEDGRSHLDWSEGVEVQSGPMPPDPK